MRWRRAAASGVALVALLTLLLPMARTAASGAIWLATVQATHTTVDKSQPSLATYGNHAHILWLEADQSHPNYAVYDTTNASGAWKTRLLSAQGPSYGGALDGPRALIAADPTIKRLYAVWPVVAGLVLYTSDDDGTSWQGPTTLVKNPFKGAIVPNIALAVGGGKVAVAFHGSASDFGKGSCKGSGYNDVFVLTYGGATWSPPQNVTACASAQAKGWRTQQLAYDATTGHFGLVAQDDSGTYRLWFAQGGGTTWSAPALTPMTNLVTGNGNAYNGDYRVAAAGGTTYVAFPLYPKKPGGGNTYVDVYLGTHTGVGGWAVQRVTQDPLACEKFDVALAALGGRIALAYRWSAQCAKTGGPREDYIHVLTGLPGHFYEVVPLQPPIPSSCLRPVISADGSLFRLVQVCGNVGAKGSNLYYTPEFLDVTGPTITALAVPATAAAPTVTLHWTAQDPQPGSGVADYEVQVRQDAGAWQWAVPGGVTPAPSLTYQPLTAGHHDTFRVRARDKVGNWGAWVSGTTAVQ